MQRATMPDATGTTTYAYDDRDRLIEKATPFGTLFNGWDATSNLTGMQSSNVNGVWTTYTYDAANRLQTLTDQNLALTTTYTRNSRDLPTRVRYGNTQRNDTAYDSRFRVTTHDLIGAAPRKLWDYTFDATGRRLTATESNGPVVSYEYDDTYKLTREEIVGDPTADGSLVYSYDPVGNRMELFSTLAALPAATYGYDLNDRLLADTYDANGNTVSSGGISYEYDFEDRLVDYDSGEVTNVYDADGNRVLRTRGASTTAYLIDEMNPTGYAQVVEEITGGSVTATYALGDQRTHQIRWESGTAAPSYYGYDAHGNVRLLTNAARTVTDRYDYDAFGNLIDATGTTFNSYFYTGEQFDPTMGLYNLRARWYAPNSGRFAAADKFEGVMCRPLSANDYVYAEADAANSIDPTGRARISVRALGGKIELLIRHYPRAASDGTPQDYQLHPKQGERTIHPSSTGSGRFISHSRRWYDREARLAGADTRSGDSRGD